MLALYSEDRITALDCSHHPFIQVVEEKPSLRKPVRVRSITADVKMKCLATKLKNKGHPLQKKSGKNHQFLLPKSRVAKLKDSPGKSKLLRSGTPISRRLRAPLERPNEREQQVEMRHQTTPNLSPLDPLIPTAVANVGKAGMCSGKALLRYFGYGIG